MIPKRLLTPDNLLVEIKNKETEEYQRKIPFEIDNQFESFNIEPIGDLQGVTDEEKESAIISYLTYALYKLLSYPIFNEDFILHGSTAIGIHLQKILLEERNKNPPSHQIHNKIKSQEELAKTAFPMGQEHYNDFDYAINSNKSYIPIISQILSRSLGIYGKQPQVLFEQTAIQEHNDFPKISQSGSNYCQKLACTQSLLIKIQGKTKIKIDVTFQPKNIIRLPNDTLKPYDLEFITIEKQVGSHNISIKICTLKRLISNLQNAYLHTHQDMTKENKYLVKLMCLSMLKAQGITELPSGITSLAISQAIEIRTPKPKKIKEAFSIKKISPMTSIPEKPETVFSDSSSQTTVKKLENKEVQTTQKASLSISPTSYVSIPEGRKPKARTSGDIIDAYYYHSPKDLEHKEEHELKSGAISSEENNLEMYQTIIPKKYNAAEIDNTTINQTEKQSTKIKETENTNKKTLEPDHSPKEIKCTLNKAKENQSEIIERIKRNTKKTNHRELKNLILKDIVDHLNLINSILETNNKEKIISLNKDWIKIHSNLQEISTKLKNYKETKLQKELAYSMSLLYVAFDFFNARTSIKIESMLIKTNVATPKDLEYQLLMLFSTSVESLNKMIINSERPKFSLNKETEFLILEISKSIDLIIEIMTERSYSKKYHNKFPVLLPGIFEIVSFFHTENWELYTKILLTHLSLCSADQTYLNHNKKNRSMVDEISLKHALKHADKMHSGRSFMLLSSLYVTLQKDFPLWAARILIRHLKLICHKTETDYRQLAIDSYFCVTETQKAIIDQYHSLSCIPIHTTVSIEQKEKGIEQTKVQKKLNTAISECRKLFLEEQIDLELFELTDPELETRLKQWNNIETGETPSNSGWCTIA